MDRFIRAALVVSVAVASAVLPASADQPSKKHVSIDQKVDAATWHRYHHTDQGTRLIPAAFLQALRTANGSMVMSPENMRKWGFLVDNVRRDALNPYGWPVGFTVSNPAVTHGVPIAGVTCALCHTGQLDYRGTAVRIEGGQGYIDLAPFQRAVFASIMATAKDPARMAAFRKDAVAAGYPADRVEKDFHATVAGAQDLLYGEKELTGTDPGPGRVDAVQGIVNAVLAADIGVPSNARNNDAPVSYPFLWDIGKFSWLQYNAFLPPEALSRNIGEVLGVGGKTHFINPATGELNPVPQRWETSVQYKNLIWLESVVVQIKAPEWPENVFGPIDRAKAATGRKLFVQRCAACHGIAELPNGLWDVRVVPLTVIGTDPNQATHWAGRTYDASKLGLGRSVTASALAPPINAIRKQFYAEDKIPASEQEPDVKFVSPCGYKARPLIGVWATPPYLHNGSVRTIFDLLSDQRPASFKFGTREYDPVHLGYVDDPSPDAMKLDTSVSGNHSTGHWWTDDQNRPGRIGPKLSDSDKYAIIEYLKSATYENYPAKKIEHERPLPCSNDPDWAKQAAR